MDQSGIVVRKHRRNLGKQSTRQVLGKDVMACYHGAIRKGHQGVRVQMTGSGGGLGLIPHISAGKTRQSRASSVDWFISVISVGAKFSCVFDCPGSCSGMVTAEYPCFPTDEDKGDTVLDWFVCVFADTFEPYSFAYSERRLFLGRKPFKDVPISYRAITTVYNDSSFSNRPHIQWQSHNRATRFLSSNDVFTILVAEHNMSLTHLW